jgi:proteic killer suppression protein
MIRSFADRDTEKVWNRIPTRRWSVEVQRAAYRKLVIIDAAETKVDLNVPPGNRLEKLAGKGAGQYSVRINKQWRICFYWRNDHADQVEITDYH